MRAMPYIVKRRFNVNGWAVDEIEVTCSACSYKEIAMLNVLDAPFSARNPEDEREEAKWKQDYERKVQYYKTFKCDRCSAGAAS